LVDVFNHTIPGPPPGAGVVDAMVFVFAAVAVFAAGAAAAGAVAAGAAGAVGAAAGAGVELPPAYQVFTPL
jgi:hypothetical protein